MTEPKQPDTVALSDEQIIGVVNEVTEFLVEAIERVVGTPYATDDYWDQASCEIAESLKDALAFIPAPTEAQ